MSALADRTTKRAGADRLWYLRGPVFGIAAGAALMLGCAVLLGKEVLPYSLLPYLTIFCVFAGSAVGGAAAAASRGKGRLTAGIAAGGAILFVILLYTLSSADGTMFGAQFVKMSIATLSGGLFGGAVSAGRADKVRKRKRGVR